MLLSVQVNPVAAYVHTDQRIRVLRSDVRMEHGTRHYTIFHCQSALYCVIHMSESRLFLPVTVNHVPLCLPKLAGQRQHSKSGSIDSPLNESDIKLELSSNSSSRSRVADAVGAIAGVHTSIP